MIISDTMLHSSSPPQLPPMTDNQKIVCGCAICNTSKHFQGPLHAWRRKQFKTMKYKADNSRGRGKYELTQSYKYYADYAFTNDETRHPRCENSSDSVLCTPTNDEFQ